MSSILPLPEVLEAVGGELGVAGGVLDVAVTEPFLDGAVGWLRYWRAVDGPLEIGAARGACRPSS